MIEELIAEEMELQAMSKLQAVSDEQQTQRLRQKQQDELIDDLVTAARSLSLIYRSYHYCSTWIKSLVDKLSICCLSAVTW